MEWDGIICGKGTRIEDTNSPSFPLTKPLHKEPIPFSSALFQKLQDQLRDQHLSTQLFASLSTTKRTCSWNSPPTKKPGNKCCFQLINKLGKKSMSQQQNNHFWEHPCPHTDLWGTLEVLQMFIRPPHVEGAVLYFPNASQGQQYWDKLHHETSWDNYLSW